MSKSTGDFLWIKRPDNAGRDGYVCGRRLSKWLFCCFRIIPAQGFPFLEDLIWKIERAPAALIDDAFAYLSDWEDFGVAWWQVGGGGG